MIGNLFAFSPSFPEKGERELQKTNRLPLTLGKTRVITSPVPRSYWRATRDGLLGKERTADLVSQPFLELICDFVVGCYRHFKAAIDDQSKNIRFNRDPCVS